MSNQVIFCAQWIVCLCLVFKLPNKVYIIAVTSNSKVAKKRHIQCHDGIWEPIVLDEDNRPHWCVQRLNIEQEHRTTLWAVIINERLTTVMQISPSLNICIYSCLPHFVWWMKYGFLMFDCVCEIDIFMKTGLLFHNTVTSDTNSDTIRQPKEALKRTRSWEQSNIFLSQVFFSSTQKTRMRSDLNIFKACWCVYLCWKHMFTDFRELCCFYCMFGSVYKFSPVRHRKPWVFFSLKRTR